jgi:hypothetical protein
MAARPGEIDQVRGPIEIAVRLSAQHMERMAGHVMGPQRQQRRELLAGMDMNQIIDDVIQKSLIKSMDVQAPPAPVPMPVPPLPVPTGPSPFPVQPGIMPPRSI